MKKSIFCFMTVVGLISASTAFAGDTGWYAFGAAGQETNDTGKADFDTTLISLGGTGFVSTYSKPTLYKLQLGYQINKNFAVEGGYVGSNDATYTATGGNLGALSASGSYSGWNIAAVGIAPINDKFSLLGKIGVADIKLDAAVTMAGIGAVSTSGSKTDLLYGVGAKIDITNTVFTRFDLDSYKVGDSTSSSRGTVWSIGLGVKF